MPSSPARPVAPVVPIADNFLDSAWFKEARLDTFSVRDGSARLVELTPAQEKRYLQQAAKPYSQYTPSYFYSLQQNTPARQEITVLTYDGEYMSDLWRLVYDARHRLISRQKVAGSGVDGEQGTTVTGWFATPERFRSVFRDEWSSEDTTFVRHDIDSIVTDYAVAKEQFRQLRKHRYQRHYRRPLRPD